MNQVVERLKSMNPTITQSPIDPMNQQTVGTLNDQQSISSNIKTSGFHGELSQVMENFNIMNLEEMIVEPLTSSSEKIINRSVETSSSSIERIINRSVKPSISSSERVIRNVDRSVEPLRSSSERIITNKSRNNFSVAVKEIY